MSPIILRFLFFRLSKEITVVNKDHVTHSVFFMSPHTVPGLDTLPQHLPVFLKLNKNGLSIPCCLMDLLTVYHEYLSLGSNHHSCLQSNVYQSAPSRLLQPIREKCPFPSSPSSSSPVGPCQKACLSSKEHMMTPSSSPHSLAAAASSLMTVEMSVALLPSSNPKNMYFVRTVVPILHVPQFHFK